MVRRGAGQPEGMRRSRPRASATTTTSTTQAYAAKIWYWTTPIKQCLDGRDRRRVHRLPGLDRRLDGDQGLTSARTMAADVTEQEIVAAASPPGRGGRRRSCTVTRACAPAGWSRRRCCGSGLIYLVALAALFVTAFWTVELRHRRCARVEPRQLHQALRARRLPHGHPPHHLVAVAVTVIDAILALPIAFYMAKVARPACAKLAGGRGADAAVGELPGQGVRLAGDDQAGGSARVDLRLDAWVRR